MATSASAWPTSAAARRRGPALQPQDNSLQFLEASLEVTAEAAAATAAIAAAWHGGVRERLSLRGMMTVDEPRRRRQPQDDPRGGALSSAAAVPGRL